MGAREVLRLLHLQEPNRNQKFHPEGARYLLCKMLRGKICHQVHQVQQGDYPGWCDLQTILGTENASPALIVRNLLQARDLPQEMISLIVLTVLVNCSARDAQPAANPSQVLEAQDSSPSRVVTGTTTASSAPAARAAWWARASSLMGRTSSAPSVPRRS